jgi:hypothetical protein
MVALYMLRILQIHLLWRQVGCECTLAGLTLQVSGLVLTCLLDHSLPLYTSPDKLMAE